MATNKVVYGNTTLIDLTSDTATAADVVSGKSFHSADGVLRSGSLDISGKADKVSNATNGNLAGLDSTGNLTDSGKSPSDFVGSVALANEVSTTSYQALYVDNSLNAIISGSRYMETTATLSTSAPTTVTFTNNVISSDKVIDVFAGRSGGDVQGSKNEFPHDSIFVSGATCTVTFPKENEAISIKVRIYIR